MGLDQLNNTIDSRAISKYQLIDQVLGCHHSHFYWISNTCVRASKPFKYRLNCIIQYPQIVFGISFLLHVKTGYDISINFAHFDSNLAYLNQNEFCMKTNFRLSSC